MNWLSSHFWELFGGIGGTALVALVIFLLQQFFSEPAGIRTPRTPRLVFKIHRLQARPSPTVRPGLIDRGRSPAQRPLLLPSGLTRGLS
jgi:hypothetical protein